MNTSYFILLLIIVLLLCIIAAQQCYYRILYSTFRTKSNNIMYDTFLTHFIQVVSQHNYFMNYGIWDTTLESRIDTLKDANENMCRKIYQLAQLNEHDTFHILDIGCGYGQQDLYWQSKLSPTSSILGVDISEKQMTYASQTSKDLSLNNLEFIVCDAQDVVETLHRIKGISYLSSFHRILSLESAFHYENRPLFFANVRQLLHNDGLFVITDILLQKKREEYTDVFSNTFLTIFGDFLCFPAQNMITLDRWTEQMEESGLQVVEKKIVTHLTFVPYYRHFFHVYCQNKGWSSWMANLLNFTFQSVQPFEYVIAVCKKREKEIPPKK